MKGVLIYDTRERTHDNRKEWREPTGKYKPYFRKLTSYNHRTRLNIRRKGRLEGRLTSRQELDTRTQSEVLTDVAPCHLTGSRRFDFYLNDTVHV